MDEVFVHKHAYKHGLSKADILHAWRNAYASQIRSGLWPPQHLAIGPSTKGKDIQLVVVWDHGRGQWIIFHAMSATHKAQKELGLI